MQRGLNMHVTFTQGKLSPHMQYGFSACPSTDPSIRIVHVIALPSIFLFRQSAALFRSLLLRLGCAKRLVALVVDDGAVGEDLLRSELHGHDVLGLIGDLLLEFLVDEGVGRVSSETLGGRVVGRGCIPCCRRHTC